MDRKLQDGNLGVVLVFLFLTQPRDNLNSSLSKVCNTEDEVDEKLNNIVQ